MSFGPYFVVYTRACTHRHTHTNAAVLCDRFSVSGPQTENLSFCSSRLTVLRKRVCRSVLTERPPKTSESPPSQACSFELPPGKKNTTLVLFRGLDTHPCGTPSPISSPHVAVASGWVVLAPTSCPLLTVVVSWSDALLLICCGL